MNSGRIFGMALLGAVLGTAAIGAAQAADPPLKVGLLDIAKSKGDIFLDRLEQRLSERGLEVHRYAKPTNTRPAPTPLYQQIADEVDVVIEALSD